LSPNAKSSVAEALLEYLVLVLPVAFYVCLEAYHKHDFDFFYRSAEWAIATIFLMFQGSYLFVKHSISHERRLSETRVALLALLALTVVVTSAMNALDSMHAESDGKVVFRMVLFTVTSLLFLVLVASSKYKNGHIKHG
jgi:peptidoglycan/LPS O-acetylase OafA/YrhL